MKYRITVEVLDGNEVRDPCGALMLPEQWRMSYYQSFNNELHDEVSAAIAVAVNKVMSESPKAYAYDRRGK